MNPKFDLANLAEGFIQKTNLQHYFALEKTFDDLKIFQTSFELFRSYGVTYKANHFIDLVFLHSEFASTVFENCYFKNTAFKQCTFRSTRFVKCVFDSCTFEFPETPLENALSFEACTLVGFDKAETKKIVGFLEESCLQIEKQEVPVEPPKKEPQKARTPAPTPVAEPVPNPSRFEKLEV